ncbi:riboflavin kinase/FAD synthetase [Spiroplasma sp. TIUS-1]|uniref:hypothetical protein n=1 Tax=Spiroplasma sp. TIUS-1 TaxID=216963 RepID=UPI0013976B61|nr:hypothetical protein [Spiroplasma sp. TIUS-1]QHX35892.1 riboflavin kinase/FAD synthetase [Spiroplasma sp. TIUS-1]
MVNNLHKIIFNKDEKFNFKINSNVMCIGFFDGLHSIHKSILLKTKEIADEFNYSSSVFTFEEKIGKNTFKLFSNETKYEKINSEFNIDFIFEMQVNDYTKSTSYNDFLDYIVNILKVKKVIVGSDIKFGYKAQGNLESLIKKLGKENVIVFEREMHTSSTKAREYINSNNFEAFNNLMGYYFEAQFVSNSDGTFKLANDLNFKNGIYSVEINNKIGRMTIVDNMTRDILESMSVKIIKLIEEF